MNTPTVIICIDGLDPEYLEACEAPNLRELSKKGFHTTGRCMMPSVTNVNNVSLVTASYPDVHGICSNFWFDPGRGEGTYLESGEYILAETIFQKAQKQGRSSVLVTSKDKLRTLLGNGAAVTVSSEQPPDWVVAGVGPSPEIYSLEVNGWVIRAAGYIMSQRPADLVYIATTDYAMHTYGPDHPQSQRHLSIMDEAIGELVEAYPDMTLLVTADHGHVSEVSDGGPCAGLDKPADQGSHGAHNQGPVRGAPRQLGRLHVLAPSAPRPCRSPESDKETPGVEDAISREEAVARFRLRGERIGDIVVTGEANAVFGDVTEVAMPPNLRTHGSTHENLVPLIGYNGDFAGFSFEENRDIGRYVFDRVLA